MNTDRTENRQDDSEQPIIPTASEAMMIAIGKALNPRFNADAFVRTARQLAFERQPSHQSIH